jgi:hypothetical protein
MSPTLPRLLVVLTGLGLVRALAPAAPAANGAIAVGPHALIFADDSGVQEMSRLVRTFHPATTQPQPVVVADRPWEGVRVYIYGSVLQDPATGGFRMWYQSRPGSGPETGVGVPGLRATSPDLTLYATSPDGLHWAKPALGLYPYHSDRGTNIVFDLGGPSVLLDSFDRDPARRYKMLGTMGHSYWTACSPDGLHWTSPSALPALPFWDTITLAQDPVTGGYLAFHKRPAMVRGFPRRVIWLSRSADFSTWSAPRLVLVPDATDDAWVTQPGQRTEIYDMSVIPYASGFIGFPAIFRVLRERPRSQLAPGQSPVDGPIDIQLATSRDGEVWRRSWPRLAIVPRGLPGTFDGGVLLGVASTVVDTTDHTWLYYTGINTTHGGTLPPKRVSIGRAEWRRDGFASLDADPCGGRLETRPLRLGGNTLVVNADARRGELRVALLGEDGRALPGYRLADAVPFAGNSTHQIARWRTTSAVPTDRPVRVVVEMSGAQLYSLRSPN